MLNLTVIDGVLGSRIDAQSLRSLGSILLTDCVVVLNLEACDCEAAFLPSITWVCVCVLVHASVSVSVCVYMCVLSKQVILKQYLRKMSKKPPWLSYIICTLNTEYKTEIYDEMNGLY